MLRGTQGEQQQPDNAAWVRRGHGVFAQFDDLDAKGGAYVHAYFFAPAGIVNASQFS